MKLNDPISGKTFDRVAYVCVGLGIVLLLAAALMRLVGAGPYGAVGIAGLALTLLALRISEWFSTQAHADDRAIEANKKRAPSEPEQRVGTHPWAYYGLAFALVALAGMFLAAWLAGT